MRTTVIGIFAAFALWAGFWVYGQDIKANEAQNWFESQQEAGWIAEYDSLDVAGFPNRFDTVITGLSLADPQSGWAWEAPRFQILSLSYQPNHLILVFPESHRLRTPKESFNIQHSELRGSVVFERNSDFHLNRSSFVGENIVWSKDGSSQDASETVKVRNLNLSTRRTPGQVFDYDIALDATGIEPGSKILSMIGSTQESGDANAVSLRATAGFRGIWDGPSLAQSGPDLSRLDIEELTMNWQDMKLRAAGDLEVDRQGYPSGTLDMRAENWQSILDVAVENGIFSTDVAGAVRVGLELVARFAGSEDFIEFRLGFSNRRTYIGPFPIGEAPVIWPVQRQ